MTQLFGSNKKTPRKGPSTFLTNKDEEDGKKPKKRINLELDFDDSSPGREFTLHKCSLKKLKESYYSYKGCHDSLVYAAEHI